jgi:hypothetical protein
MPKFGLIILSLLLFATPSSSFAQKRVEVGIFIDYLGISQTSTDNFGLGGRFGYRIHRNVMLEGELAYDYGINFDEAYRNISTGDIPRLGAPRSALLMVCSDRSFSLREVDFVPSSPSRAPSWISG